MKICENFQVITVDDMSHVRVTQISALPDISMGAHVSRCPGAPSRWERARPLGVGVKYDIKLILESIYSRRGVMRTASTNVLLLLVASSSVSASVLILALAMSRLEETGRALQEAGSAAKTTGRF